MAVKDSRLNGLNTLSYMGNNAYSPPNVTTNTRAPTTGDRKGFYVGDEWIDTTTTPENVWKLVSLEGGSATWLEISTGSSTALQFDSDSGSAVPALGIITMGGGTNIVTSGSGSTVTFNAVTATDVATSYDADTGTATPATNTLTVTGGTGIDTSGAGAVLTIDASSDVATSYAGDSGTATPAANVITIAGGTNVATSASGSTVTVNATGGGSGGANTCSFLAYQATDGGQTGRDNRVYVGDTLGLASFTGTAPGSTFEVGQWVTVVTVPTGPNPTNNYTFEVVSLGTPAAMTVTYTSATGTFNTTTGEIILSSLPTGTNFEVYFIPKDSTAQLRFELGRVISMTEVFDVGSDFYIGDGSGELSVLPAKFTAPQDGKYQLIFQINRVLAYGISVPHRNYSMYIITSNRTYRKRVYQISGVGADVFYDDGFSRTLSIITDMEASDTAIFRIYDYPFVGNQTNVGVHEKTSLIAGGNDSDGYYQTFVSGSLL